MFSKINSVLFIIVIAMAFLVPSAIEARERIEWGQVLGSIERLSIAGARERTERMRIQAWVLVQTPYGLAWMRQADANAYATRGAADDRSRYTDAEIRALDRGIFLYRYGGSSSDGSVWQGSGPGYGGGFTGGYGGSGGWGGEGSGGFWVGGRWIPQR